MSFTTQGSPACARIDLERTRGAYVIVVWRVFTLASIYWIVKTDRNSSRARISVGLNKSVFPERLSWSTLLRFSSLFTKKNYGDSCADSVDHNVG